MKTIAAIATQTEFKAFKSFLHYVEGVKFVRIEYPHEIQGLELSGFIDTNTVHNDIQQIISLAKTRVR